MIRIDKDACNNPSLSIDQEWLETNGIGGFASSTVAGIHTRRYHGLLMAATQPPAGRVLLLSKVEETLVIGDQRFDLSANQYPGVVHPRGFELLHEFRLDPFPVFVYRAGKVEVEKRVFMVHAENTTVVEYAARSLDGDALQECHLELRPLIAFRDFHSTTHRNDAANTSIETSSGSASVRPYEGLPRLHFGHNAAALEPAADWYFNLEFQVEGERGLDFHEDLLNPFVARYDLQDQPTAVLIASTLPRMAPDADRLRQSEIERRKQVVSAAEGQPPLIEALYRAADQFIVKRGEFKTVIAGYHWFGDWGRDTMIALPGLTLVTGHYEIARDILREFSEHIDGGMLPNRFPDAGEIPEYNTVDATLWFFEAIRSYVEYTSDYEFVQEHLYNKLKEIIDWHVRGTRYSIKVNPDGLLSCGEDGVQLTWMDSKIGDWVVTPRTGKAVEIQALWYNALKVMQDLARQFGDHDTETTVAKMAEYAATSFNAQFWNDDAGCLYDVVNGEDRDGAIRPNQIFAISLKHSMLDRDKARRVVDVVRRELLTPAGLRSLSPRDSRYRPRYEGSVWDRDSAYHQGTVWPWLLGAFISAHMKINCGEPGARTEEVHWLDGNYSQMQSTGLGQISEIADAESPHHPRGCIAQAWSVAELLRAALEDVYQGVPSLHASAST